MSESVEIDRLSRRCPRLGGLVEFGYCRSDQGADHPCVKIFDCWWEYFDVTAYLKQVLPQDILQRLEQAQPKSKVQSILELIAQAKQRAET